MASILTQKFLWKFLIIVFLTSLVYVTLISLDVLGDVGKNDDQDVFSIHAHGDLSMRHHGMKHRIFNSMSPPRMQIVVIVLSNADNVKRRSHIRDTFLKPNYTAPFSMKTVFVTGNAPTHNKQHEDVISGAFNDNDRYSNTRKTLLGIKWTLSLSSDARFVVVVTDNMYVNYELLGKHLFNGYKDSLLSDRILIGNVKKDLASVRISSSKWYMPYAEYPEERLPTFCTMDTGVVLSTSAVKHLLDWSSTSSILPLVDVYIGCAARIGSWSIITDEKVIPKPDQSINICAYRDQTVTADFNTNEMWNLTSVEDGEKTFKQKFSQECQHPDLQLILKHNVSNAEYFSKALTLQLNASKTCFDQTGAKLSNLTLIMLINSHPDHSSRRKGIRNTWAKRQTIDSQEVRIIFVMGVTSKMGINREVEIEAQHHKDIILGDFVESFRNLTLKLILGLRWVDENCRHARFLYKGDDDMFVNVGNLLGALNNMTINNDIDMKRLYMGELNKGEVVRNVMSKYYVSEKEYSGKYYPTFCPGGGYVLSTAIIPALYRKSLTTQIVPIDDALQGILANLIGVVPVHHPGFRNWNRVYDSCTLQNEVITLHGFTNEYKFNDIWAKFNAPC